MKKSLLAAAAFFGLTAAAAAAPINYAFTLTVANGPQVGTYNGTFSYDSSSITPGAINDAAGLLTAVDFTFAGVTYTAATLNTGRLEFDLAGNLTSFFFGNNCVAGFCVIFSGTNDFYFFDDGVADAFPTQFFYSDSSVNDIFTESLVLTRLPDSEVSEPATLALLGAGLLGLAAVRRRKTA